MGTLLLILKEQDEGKMEFLPDRVRVFFLSYLPGYTSVSNSAIERCELTELALKSMIDFLHFFQKSLSSKFFFYFEKSITWISELII